MAEEIRPEIETNAKIKVVGIGGGGGSAVTRMIQEKLRGIEFIAVNTDAQALHANAATIKIAIGKTVTRGLGAGMNPEIGRRAVEENASELRNALAGSDMVFLTAGLGGGTGSGAITEIAKIAKEVGALTVAVVTKPFSFEGAQRRRIAEEAHADLCAHVDTIITIPNDRVLQVIDKKTSIADSFRIIDDVLRQGVQGISEMITLPGEPNVDFADVKQIMQNSGTALMGIGKASGDNRAMEAAKQAISSPLLEISIDGAKGILFTVTGSSNVSMFEVQEAANVITGAADDDARVIFGLNYDEAMGDELRVTVIATGFGTKDLRRATTPPDSLSIPARSWKQTGTPPPTPPNIGSSPSTPVEPPIARSFFGQNQNQTQSVPFAVRTVGESTAIEPPRHHQQSSARDSQAVPTSNKNSTNINAKSSPTATDDEDLSIPAFIRRKMM